MKHVSSQSDMRKAPEAEAQRTQTISVHEQESTYQKAFDLVTLLMNKGWHISFAESCTGGLLSGRLINASGASCVYKSGYITYSNEEKVRILGVSERTLQEYGAVSRQTASEMALGCAKASNTDFAVSVTGIAGPNGGTVEKPVGLVYVGCAYHDQCKVIELHLSGQRQMIRQESVEQALKFLHKTIISSTEIN